MGLSPKGPLSTSKLGWQELDKALKLFITKTDSMMVLNPDDYEMPRSEIINELKKNGYSIHSDNGSGTFYVGA
ncbi:hypothetical protein [Liquorilactobacillus uvarum]|uniref:hypothetical protein n=1 Tax=Liquorilactobacillus uvarum TaxID=303240 RepID=UPI00288BFCD3|nr:hypothetical protein [Liquorilactobacillus uvarum]